MNKPPLSLVALLAIAPLLAGGCTLYSNPSACKAQLREAVHNAAPDETLSVSHVGVGIGGSRVVVEGTLKTAAASKGAPDVAATSKGAPDVAAATGASDAAAPQAASQPVKPVEKPAAAECLFDGDKLTALRWLAPPELAKPAVPDSKG